MWQVTYNLSLVVAPGSGGNVSSSGQKATVHEFKSQCCQTGVRKVAGEKPEVLPFLQTGEYCQQ